MLSSVMSNPIIKQLDRIVQSVNNKAQKDVQHIRQARKDTVVISAQSLYMAEEAKKMKEAQQPTDSQPVKKVDRFEEGYAKRARDGYRNRYAHLYDTGNKLRDVTLYCEEAKRYTELANRDNISEEQREKYVKASEAARQYCVELARKYGEDVLTTAGFERGEAEKIKKKSAFEGITEDSLGLFDLDNKSVDEILEAIDKAIPMIEKAAENVNHANMIEYNKDLSKYRPNYRPEDMKFISKIVFCRLSNILSFEYNKGDAKVNPEKSMQFDPNADIKHMESFVNTDPEYAIANGTFSSALYPDYKFSD